MNFTNKSSHTSSGKVVLAPWQQIHYTYAMNKSKKIILVIIVSVCAFLMVLTPSIFAQTSESTIISKSVQSRQYMDLLNSVFSFVMQNYVDEVDPAVLYEGAMKGLMDSLGDPYTAYMEPTQQRSLNDTTAGSFGGGHLQNVPRYRYQIKSPLIQAIKSPQQTTYAP